MIFIVYSQTNAKTIADNVGRPEYSYYFILKSYLPFLEEMGEVRYVYEPAREVDEIYKACKANGEACVFLHFSAPQNYIEGIECPTLHVLAWEYSTVPNEPWNNEDYQNWRPVFSSIAGVVTISEYSAEIVRKEMGQDYPVVSIPCPVWDGMDRLRGDPLISEPIKNYTLEFDGVVIDSSLADLTINLPTEEELDAAKREGDAQMFLMQAKNERLDRGLRELQEKTETTYDEIRKEWRHINAHLKKEWEAIEAERGRLEGAKKELEEEALRAFSKLHWKSFSNNEAQLGTLMERIGFFWSYAKQLSEGALIALGDEVRAKRKWATAEYDTGMKSRDLDARTTPSACTTYQEHEDEVISDIEAFKTISQAEAEDVEKTDGSDTKTDDVVKNTVSVKGVIYTAILNPYDGRKNWVDMVVAFCWAFREVADATLVLKVSAQHIVHFSDELILYLQRLAPFKCRVVAIYAFLDDETYDALLRGTSFYVNTSYGEGQSIPLCEAFSCGIPGVAPKHTAMRDYVFEDSTVIFKTNLELTHWQHDPRRSYRCMHYKPDWLDLVNAYRRSYEIAKTDKVCYQEMGSRAIDHLREHCSLDRTSQDFRVFIEQNAHRFKCNADETSSA